MKTIVDLPRTELYVGPEPVADTPNSEIWTFTPTGETFTSAGEDHKDFLLELILLDEARQAIQMIMDEEQKNREQDLIDNWDDVIFN